MTASQFDRLAILALAGCVFALGLIAGMVILLVLTSTGAVVC